MDSLAITLHVATDASDWDSFRCWLGGAGLRSLALALVSPLLTFPAALGSLIYVGEDIRQSVGDMTTAIDLGDFALVSQSDDELTYQGSKQLDPVPFSSITTSSCGPGGLDIVGAILPPPVGHKVSFNPDSGDLSGDWMRKINCSLRSMDEKFLFQAVLITDRRTDLSKVAVRPYLSSVAEPEGRCWVKSADAAMDLSVTIDGSGLVTGDIGFAVIHCSAGLRAYKLGPVAPHQTPPRGIESLINKFCDTFHVPSLVIDIQELRWIQPAPGYSWGYEALKQWQIVLDHLSPAATIDIRSTAGDQVIASQDNFARSEGRAAIELITSGDTDLVMRTSGVGDGARCSVTTRWLLPVERFAAPHDARALHAGGRQAFPALRGSLGRVRHGPGHHPRRRRPGPDRAPRPLARARQLGRPFRRSCCPAPPGRGRDRETGRNARQRPARWLAK